MTYLMTQTTQLQMSLARWAIALEISQSTLAKWAYQMDLKAPFDNSKIITAISFGKGTAENARGASKQNALINLQKIDRALTWL